MCVAFQGRALNGLFLIELYYAKSDQTPFFSNFECKYIFPALSIGVNNSKNSKMSLGHFWHIPVIFIGINFFKFLFTLEEVGL